jgi:uncharacterized membrane protein YdfJ with MMPL/SSD domain
VRSLLVPAVTLDAGRRIWWPNRAMTAQTAPEEAGSARMAG